MGYTAEDLLRLLDLEPIEVNIYRGTNRDIGSGRVFGGQVLAQALVAARRTIDEEREAQRGGALRSEEEVAQRHRPKLGDDHPSPARVAAARRGSHRDVDRVVGREDAALRRKRAIGDPAHLLVGEPEIRVAAGGLGKLRLVEARQA